MEDVIIVGAGLSGLTAAYYLKKEGINALVLEARERWGGRILTVPAGANRTPVEMGATWFADKHTYLMALLAELNLPFFEQFYQGISVMEPAGSAPPQRFEVDQNAPPSYRLAGGTSALVHALTGCLAQDQIVLQCPVSEVADREDHVEITSTAGCTYRSRRVLLTIPPFLIYAQGIRFTPQLPDGLLLVMQQTHTWMSDAVKFALSYQTPFWREQGYSGTVLSQAGIAREVYDHTNAANTRFALKGFLSPEADALSRSAREHRVVDQLAGLLGKKAYEYLSYTEKRWQEEVFTHADYGKMVFPHQNNGHPFLRQPLMNRKLYLAGTETSPFFGGYLDGAVHSGLAAAQNVLTHA